MRHSPGSKTRKGLQPYGLGALVPFPVSVAPLIQRTRISGFARGLGLEVRPDKIAKIAEIPPRQAKSGLAVAPELPKLPKLET